MLALLKVLEFSISCGTFSPPRSYDKSIIPLFIYPHISYVIVAWGSAYKTHVNKLLTSKTKSFCKSRFFEVLYGENTLSTLPLLNLPDFLTINNVYQFNALKFIHDWHKQSLPSIFNNSFHYAKNVHSHNTRYASQNNLYKSRFRTNMGKQTVSDMATNIWQNLPSVLKELNTFILKKGQKVSGSKTF